MGMRRFGIIGVALALGTLHSLSASEFFTGESPGEPCPRTEKAWLGARRNLGLVVTSASARRFEGKLKACFSANEALFKRSKILQRCLKPMRDLYLRDEPAPSHLAKKSAVQYYRDTASFTELPADLNDSELQKALLSGDTAASVKDMNRLNGERKKKGQPPLVFAEVAGVHATSSDETGSRRFLIYDPGQSLAGERTEKWMNFTLPDRGSDTVPFQLSVVATHRSADGKAQTYFADHRRTDKSPHTYIPASKIRAPPKVDCVMCHLSGKPLRIDPKGPVAREFRKALETMNAAIEKVPTGIPPDFSTRFFTEGRVPIDNANIPDAFFRACLANVNFTEAPTASQTRKLASVSAVSVKKITGAMRCDRCHDGRKLAVMPVLIDPALHHIVENGRMPPDNNLSEEERKGLMRCLSRYSSRVGDTSTPGLLFHQLMGNGTDCASPEEDTSTPRNGH